MESKFDYAFWNMYPYVLGKGEECFCDLAEKFGVNDYNILSEIEAQAQDRILEALVIAYQRDTNPFKSSREFVLANLINKYKIDCLITYICETQGLNPDDFEHHAYDDGAFLDVKYKGEVIA